MNKKKLEITLQNLPLNTQRDFRIALEHKKLTPETFIPKHFDDKKVKTKFNIMRNTIVDFQHDYNIRKKLLNELNRDTTEFSKGYFAISQLRNDKKKRETEKLIYEDLIKKYSEKDYQTKNLYINENLFDKSLLLQNNKYENVLILDHNNKEYNQTKKYINKLQNLLNTDNKKNDPFQFNTSLHLKEQENKNVENYYPFDFNFKKNILLLKHDIFKTKRTIDDILNFQEFKTQSNFNSTYNNIISSTRSNFYGHKKFNSTLDTNFTSRNKEKTDLNNTTDNFSVDNKINDENKNNFYRKGVKKMTIAMKQILHNEMVNDLTNVYENIKKTNFEDCEDDIYNYLKKYKKPIPEKFK